MVRGLIRSKQKDTHKLPNGGGMSIMTPETTGIAIFLGTMLGTAFSIVIARLLMDPRIKAIEDKINLLLEMMVNPPKQ